MSEETKSNVGRYLAYGCGGCLGLVAGAFALTCAGIGGLGLLYNGAQDNPDFDRITDTHEGSFYRKSGRSEWDLGTTPQACGILRDKLKTSSLSYNPFAVLSHHLWYNAIGSDGYHIAYFCDDPDKSWSGERVGVYQSGRTFYYREGWRIGQVRVGDWTGPELEAAIDPYVVER